MFATRSRSGVVRSASRTCLGRIRRCCPRRPGCCPAGCVSVAWSARPPWCRGTAGWSSGAGRTRTSPLAHRSATRGGIWPCGWPGRTPAGAPAHPGRAARAGVSGRCRHDPAPPGARRAGPGPPPRRHQLAGFPAGAGVRAAGGGLLPRGHHRVAAPVRPGGEGGGDPPGPHPRGEREPDRCVDRAAGPQPDDGPGRPGGVVSVPRSGPGRQAHPDVRRGAHRRRRAGREDPTPLAQGEPPRRTLRRQRTPSAPTTC